MLAYEAARAAARPISVGAKRTMPGTFSALIIAYYSSREFGSLAPASARARRNILERFREGRVNATGLLIGDCRVAHLRASHVEAMLKERSGTPAAAKVFVKTLRYLMQFAIRQSYRSDDPTAGIGLPRFKSDGWVSWDEEQIAAFEAHHAIGSRARLAFALLLFTAQRRSDVLRMGRQHLRKGVLSVRQQKTGATLEIPVHPALQSILDATPSDNLTFMVTANGRPFVAGAFNDIFRRWCDEAGIPKRFKPHGLRKAACRRLAELGCSANQIMAISGHRSLSEAEKYVRAADQRRLARDAIDTLTRAFPGTNSGKP
jgi:integrase